MSFLPVMARSNFLLFKTLLFPNIELEAEVDDDGRKIFLGDFN